MNIIKCESGKEYNCKTLMPDIQSRIQDILEIFLGAIDRTVSAAAGAILALSAQAGSFDGLIYVVFFIFLGVMFIKLGLQPYQVATRSQVSEIRDELEGADGIEFESDYDIEDIQCRSCGHYTAKVSDRIELDECPHCGSKNWIR